MENTLEFDDQTGKCLKLEEMFRNLLDFIAKWQKLDVVMESLTIVDDETIHKLNLEYRGTDRPTDVLSFSFEEGEDANILPFKDLGEVVISLDTAIKQADEFKHPVCRELAFLFIHGTLHNLGYDHARSHEDAEIMFALQNDILNNYVYEWEDSKWQNN